MLRLGGSSRSIALRTPPYLGVQLAPHADDAARLASRTPVSHHLAWVCRPIGRALRIESSRGDAFHALARDPFPRASRVLAAPKPDPQASGGRRPAHGRAASSAAAARRTAASPQRRPTICSPTGSPSAVQPAGTEIAGSPVTVIAYVSRNQSM